MRGDVLRHFASQRVKRKIVFNLVDESELRLKEIRDRPVRTDAESSLTQQS